MKVVRLKVVGLSVWSEVTSKPPTHNLQTFNYIFIFKPRERLRMSFRGMEPFTNLLTT